MKRLAGFSALTALAAIVSTTSGCSWLWGDEGYIRDRNTDYLEARQAAPMKLPADVDAKRLDPLLSIPSNVAVSTETPDKFEVPRPQPLVASGDASPFSLQKNGDAAWLVAQRAPAEVWPGAHEFFVSNGFRIAEERPQTGEFVTAWQPVSELSAFMARRFDGKLSKSDNEVRVRVRIEPGVQRNTSEVYVSTVEREAGSRDDVAFPAHVGNAALETALLTDMQNDMSQAAEQGGSVSLLAARDFDAPDRVSLAQDGNGNLVLNLGTDLDRAWSSVGRALEQGNVRVDDLNRSLGVYYINLAEGARDPAEKPGFFKRLFGSEPSKEEVDARAERYQVRLTSAGGGVQVTVEKDINTVAPEETARRILNLIQENLG
jgi:outer membrane protein assembly factor BamC